MFSLVIMLLMRTIEMALTLAMFALFVKLCGHYITRRNWGESVAFFHAQLQNFFITGSLSFFY